MIPVGLTAGHRQRSIQRKDEMMTTNLLAVLALASCVTGCFSPNVRTFRNDQVEAIGSRSGDDWRYHSVTIGTQGRPFDQQTPLTVRISTGKTLTSVELITNTTPIAALQSNGVFVVQGSTVTQCVLRVWAGVDGQWHNPVLVSPDGRDLKLPISEKELIRLFGEARLVQDRFSW